MNKLKLFLFKSPRSELNKQPLLIKLLNSDNKFEGGLFQEIPTSPFRSLVVWVNEISKADYLVLPINYVVAIKDQEYLKSFFQVAEKNNLRVLITNHGDYTEPIEVRDGFALKTSAYKSKLKKNEIVIPAFVEDIGVQHNVGYRQKENDIPTIGFSGMVDLPSFSAEFKYQLRLIRQWLFIFFKVASPASYQGLYYRRIAIKKIRQSILCKPHFNIRSSFGRNVKTIQGSPEQLRREFIESITESDLALVIRGDGNFSLRLFEVLSLGRIPLFIDTDSPLPFEDRIDYDSFMVRVDHTEIHRLAEIVNEWWQNISPEEYILMQKRAREVFENYLRPDAYYKILFSELGQKRTSK